MSFSQSLVVLVLIGLTLSSSYADECQFHDSKCECAYSDGSGYTLKTLVANNSYIAAFTDKNLTYFFSPCQDSTAIPSYIVNSTNECQKGYSLCVYDSQANSLKLLGTQSEISFVEGTDHKLSMTFGKSKDNKSSVTLECSQDSENSALYAPAGSSTTEAHLFLFSKLSCKTEIYEDKQPGFFSTFFLVLFIMFLLYVVFGMLYQYFLVGARGFEILPNYDFWSKVWLSLRLGFIYLKNGCRVLPAEDTYDAI